MYEGGGAAHLEDGGPDGSQLRGAPAGAVVARLVGEAVDGGLEPFAGLPGAVTQRAEPRGVDGTDPTRMWFSTSS
ncbi:hypothetical protein SSPO_003680 [Streptomyces antimycoticus]|uniref:Uncharacterized protein n=1 Tax=Streptomyces antimycoticus TaxID=68175 RepID=A0A499UD25_9ACTN|nr:hypothetical protein SSPO_003680 [Streptomyces antimycoticus]